MTSVVHSEDLDSDALPPTQQLILELLAARHRLGEPFWTFARKHGPSLRKLADAGWLRFQNAVTDDWRASLTDAGRAAMCAPTYQSPLQVEVERLRDWVRSHFDDYLD